MKCCSRMSITSSPASTAKTARACSLQGGEPFCSSPSRFAILGREHCDQRYYSTTLFTPISAHQRQGLVVDFTEHDFLPAGQQPRQLQVSQASVPDVVTQQMAPAHGLAPPTAPQGTGD